MVVLVLTFTLSNINIATTASLCFTFTWHICLDSSLSNYLYSLSLKSAPLTQSHNLSFNCSLGLYI